MEKARELRKRSDQGDADAAFDFGLLLLGTSSGRTRLDGKQKVELRELSNGLTASGWMLKAAKAGSKPAIEFACEIGKDALAPADLRQQGQEACEQAGKK